MGGRGGVKRDFGALKCVPSVGSGRVTSRRIERFGAPRGSMQPVLLRHFRLRPFHPLQNLSLVWVSFFRDLIPGNLAFGFPAKEAAITRAAISRIPAGIRNARAKGKTLGRPGLPWTSKIEVLRAQLLSFNFERGIGALSPTLLGYLSSSFALGEAI